MSNKISLTDLFCFCFFDSSLYNTLLLEKVMTSSSSWLLKSYLPFNILQFSVFCVSISFSVGDDLNALLGISI